MAKSNFVDDGRQEGLEKSLKLTDQHIYVINLSFENYIRENGPMTITALYNRLEREADICLFGKANIFDFLDRNKFVLKGTHNELVALRDDYVMKKDGSNFEKLMMLLSDFRENAKSYSRDDIHNLCEKVIELFPEDKEDIIKDMKKRYLDFIKDNI